VLTDALFWKISRNYREQVYESVENVNFGIIADHLFCGFSRIADQFSGNDPNPDMSSQCQMVLQLSVNEVIIFLASQHRLLVLAEKKEGRILDG
jgi:hypothetical protein